MAARTCSGTAALRGARPEQHHLALGLGGEVVLDRPVDLGRGGRGGQSPRKGVEIGHLLFALAGELGLPLHRIRHVARHQRDDQEQSQIEEFGPLVVRGIE
jgi:hypothetical protein